MATDAAFLSSGRADLGPTSLSSMSAWSHGANCSTKEAKDKDISAYAQGPHLETVNGVIIIPSMINVLNANLSIQNFLRLSRPI